MTSLIADIEQVAFSYNDQVVLENVSLKIFEGDFVAMIGPNGGGKTTLLKLILGLLPPSKGKIHIFDRPPQKTSYLLGYVPQDVHINQNFPITAIDVVLMGKLLPGKRWQRNPLKDRQEALAALRHMEMEAFADTKIGELSGGQRQRIFIARALVTKPRLLLLDEPTASIDSKGQADFFRLLEALNKEMTILMVSHDLLAISRHVKSVACVNRHLHYHHHAEITGDMLEIMYPCTVEEVCPVELVAHGLPHRVLKDHQQ
jgi:zinc transport system ATP-binding protein